MRKQLLVRDVLVLHAALVGELLDVLFFARQEMPTALAASSVVKLRVLFLRLPRPRGLLVGVNADRDDLKVLTCFEVNLPQGHCDLFELDTALAGAVGVVEREQHGPLAVEVLANRHSVVVLIAERNRRVKQNAELVLDARVLECFGLTAASGARLCGLPIGRFSGGLFRRSLVADNLSTALCE